MPSEDNKKMTAWFTVIAMAISGGGLGIAWNVAGKYFVTHDHLEENNKDFLSVNSFKRYQLTNDVENAKAKLAQYEELSSLTLNQQAEVKYLSDAIGRWQNKLLDLDDE